MSIYLHMFGSVALHQIINSIYHCLIITLELHKILSLMLGSIMLHELLVLFIIVSSEHNRASLDPKPLILILQVFILSPLFVSCFSVSQDFNQ